MDPNSRWLALFLRNEHREMRGRAWGERKGGRTLHTQFIHQSQSFLARGPKSGFEDLDFAVEETECVSLVIAVLQHPSFSGFLGKRQELLSRLGMVDTEVLVLGLAFFGGMAFPGREVRSFWGEVEIDDVGEREGLEKRGRRGGGEDSDSVGRLDFGCDAMKRGDGTYSAAKAKATNLPSGE